MTTLRSDYETAQKSYNPKDAGQEPSPLDHSSTYLSWALSLPRMIIACRARLSWSLVRSFSATWWRSSLPTATFPLPVPHPGCFDSSGPGLSKRRLAKVARQRLLHITVFCFNFVYLGRPATLDEIGRRPNKWQDACFQHLRSLLLVCGADDQAFKLAPGRSGPELGAALYQLEQFAAGWIDKIDSYRPHKPFAFKEDTGLLPPEQHPELQPYKNLNADRLKIVGDGRWPLADYLDGPLWLPYQEPRFLMRYEDVSHLPVPNLVHEVKKENLKLCKIWDAKGLLSLARAPLCEGHFSKVFNAYKSAEVDRQIGDRRIPNSRERSIDGPSSELPPGFLLTCLRTEPYAEQLVASITDRRDYYHQAAVTPERARSNMLPFVFTEEELSGCAALDLALQKEKIAKRCRRRREDAGDGFGGFSSPAPQKKGWYATFSSLFQGDHLGVEFALQSHEKLLVNGGRLIEENRLRGHHPFPLSRSLEGLIIDDFFAIGVESTHTASCNTFAARALAEAREIYQKAGLPGSPEKDVEAASTFKAAGAEVISSEQAVKIDRTTVGAPFEKRLGLSTLSLRAARLPSTTSRLISRLGGNWTSVLLYRRSMTAVIDDLFRLASDAERSGKNEVISQPVSVRNELIVLAALAPVLVTNTAVHCCPFAYASDASLGKGAFNYTPIGKESAEVLWLGSDKKGSYTRLEGFPRAALSALREKFDTVDEAAEAAIADSPKKGLLMYYDFVEFYGGSGRVSKAAYDLGLTVAPPLDLDASPHFDLSAPRLLEWAFHMIETGRFRSFMTEPPCATYSAAAYPALRSFAQPEGFDPTEARTKHGTLLSNRSFLLLRHGRRHRRPCLKEQPRTSKMAWRKAWKQMLDLGFEEAVVASCQFGSPHKKEFRLLCYLLDVAAIETRCPGGHSHIKIEGAYTAPSAVYTWDLARHLALHFYKALRREAWREGETAPVEGHESVVTNDLLISRQWHLGKVWHWKSKAHINILESRGALEVVKDVAVRHSSQRAVGLLDSRVAKGALAKGRSTAKGLQRTCKAVAAFELARDIYMGWLFAPTRLNTADDPTRDVPVRKAFGLVLSDYLPQSDLQLLHSRAVSRFAANWIRLVLLVYLVHGSEASSIHSTVGFSLSLERLSSTCDLLGFPSELFDLSFRFLYQTCPAAISATWTHLWTFPWNLPSFGLFRFLASVAHLAIFVLGSLLLLAPLISLILNRKVQRLVWILSIWTFVASPLGIGPGILVCAEAMDPATAADLKRAAYRSPQGIIPTRVARQATLDARQKLLDDFGRWLFTSHNVLLATLLTAKPADPEELCAFLVAYGQEMFLAGKAYGKYAETLNAVAAARPSIKKQLTMAWDLAFAWLADEPFEHHPALPLSILLAMLSVALMWGWPTEAAILSMTWAGILRIGETLMATRSDLILLQDSAPGVGFALLRIRSPKTRGRAARRQAARIDPPDIVELLTATFASWPDDKKLWTLSASTLRKRFNALLLTLGLPTTTSRGKRPFSLGSLRPGGATFLLLQCEDAEHVRRRGRWVTSKVCEIYLQEVLYTTYTEKLTQRVRNRIEQLSSAFPQVLQIALTNLRTGVPPTLWYRLYQMQDSQELGADWGRDGET